MAQVKPLRLKVQRAQSVQKTAPDGQSTVEVLVDTGVFHIDNLFSYAVPPNLSKDIQVGQRVSVPFGKQTLEGIIITLGSTPSDSPLKYINSIITLHPVLDPQSITLIIECAKRWAAHPFDIVRSAIPPRVASVDKSYISEPSSQRSNTKRRTKRSYYQFSPGENEFETLAKQSLEAAKEGQVLVVLPDLRDVEKFAIKISKFSAGMQALRLDASMDRTSRYRNYLDAINGVADIIYGSRSCVFVPMPNLSTIFLHRDVSESHYEPRTPGWNVRDVAVLRSMQSKCSLIVTGFSPSSEVARLIEVGWMQVSLKKSRVLTKSFPQTHGELLPPRIFEFVRSGLKQGPVLFLAPRKGYASSLICSRCRNIALCDCGGKLFRASHASEVSCSLCSKFVSPWKCSWCANDKPLLRGRGSARFTEEIGRAFPGFPVITSELGSIHESIPARPSLVIATPGCVPTVESGYGAVVILEALSLLTQLDLRAQERAREQIYSAAAKVSTQGGVGFVLEADNPVIGSVARWNPAILSQAELRERMEVALPPFARSAVIETASSKVIQILNGFRKAQEDGRIPAGVRVLGPSTSKPGRSKIVFLVELSQSAELFQFLHEYQRRLSMSKKPLDMLRIDPYSLS